MTAEQIASGPAGRKTSGHWLSLQREGSTSSGALAAIAIERWLSVQQLQQSFSNEQAASHFSRSLKILPMAQSHQFAPPRRTIGAIARILKVDAEVGSGSSGAAAGEAVPPLVAAIRHLVVRRLDTLVTPQNPLVPFFQAVATTSATTIQSPALHMRSAVQLMGVLAAATSAAVEPRWTS